MKRCGRCGGCKPRSAFYRRRRANDGLQAWCKDCSKRASREREAALLAKGLRVSHIYHEPTYNSWRCMIQRVLNPRHPSHHYYVDVSIHGRWRSFAGFLADMGERPRGHTLDRMDPGATTSRAIADGRHRPSNRRTSAIRSQGDSFQVGAMLFGSE